MPDEVADQLSLAQAYAILARRDIERAEHALYLMNAVNAGVAPCMVEGGHKAYETFHRVLMEIIGSDFSSVSSFKNMKTLAKQQSQRAGDGAGPVAKPVT